jgi:hypothetical protein
MVHVLCYGGELSSGTICVCVQQKHCILTVGLKDPELRIGVRVATGKIFNELVY